MFEMVKVLGVEYIDFDGDNGHVCGSKIWYVPCEKRTSDRLICGAIPQYLWIAGTRVSDVIAGDQYKLFYESSGRGFRPARIEPTK